MSDILLNINVIITGQSYWRYIFWKSSYNYCDYNVEGCVWSYAEEVSVTWLIMSYDWSYACFHFSMGSKLKKSMDHSIPDVWCTLNN